jgi:hypothetical protein
MCSPICGGWSHVFPFVWGMIPDILDVSPIVGDDPSCSHPLHKSCCQSFLMQVDIALLSMLHLVVIFIPKKNHVASTHSNDGQLWHFGCTSGHASGVASLVKFKLLKHQKAKAQLKCFLRCFDKVRWLHLQYLSIHDIRVSFTFSNFKDVLVALWSTYRNGMVKVGTFNLHHWSYKQTRTNKHSSVLCT